MLRLFADMKGGAAASEARHLRDLADATTQMSRRPQLRPVDATLRPLVLAFLCLLCDLKIWLSSVTGSSKGPGWASPLVAKILFLCNFCP